MKLTHLTLENFVAHRRLDLALRPLTVVCGPNGAGKSSLADAIAFALTGELRRVEGKGERKLLVSEGASDGRVTLRIEDAQLSRDVASGKLVESAALPGAEGTVYGALPYVLDAAAFGSAPVAERRELLQALLGAAVPPEAMLSRLRERGVLETVCGVLEASDDPDWEAVAARAAAEARAAWKAAAGEAYGAQKAAAWAAPVPEDAPDAGQLAAARAAVESAQAADREAQRGLGATMATASEVMRRSERKRLEGIVGGRRAWLEAIENNTAAVTAAQGPKSEAERDHAALLARLRPEITCPHCGAASVMDEAGALVPVSTATRRPGDAEVAAAAALAARTRNALDKAESELRQSRAMLAQINAAQGSLNAMGPDTRTGREDAQVAAEAAAASVAEAHAAARAELARLAGIDAAAKEARRRTEAAAEAHALVVAWTTAGVLLAPDGIPSEALAAEMERFNAALADLAHGVGWLQPRVDAGLRITANGRSRGLLSESERWRVDVLLAVALARLSKLGFVALDRFDVLDLPSRGPALAWLYKLLKAGTLDTVLLAGTFKEPPRVPGDVGVVWFGPVQGEKREAA